MLIGDDVDDDDDGDDDDDDEMILMAPWTSKGMTMTIYTRNAEFS